MKSCLATWHSVAGCVAVELKLLLLTWTSIWLSALQSSIHSFCCYVIVNVVSWPDKTVLKGRPLLLEEQWVVWVSVSLVCCLWGRFNLPIWEALGFLSKLLHMCLMAHVCLCSVNPHFNQYVLAVVLVCNDFLPLPPLPLCAELSLSLQLFHWKQLENLYFREKKFAVEVNDPHRLEKQTIFTLKCYLKLSL